MQQNPDSSFHDLQNTGCLYRLMLPLYKYDGKTFIIHPSNPSVALDIFLTGSKGNTNGNKIINAQFIGSVGLNKGATKADIFNNTFINTVKMGKNDFSIIVLSLMSASEIISFRSKYIPHSKYALLSESCWYPPKQLPYSNLDSSAERMPGTDYTNIII